MTSLAALGICLVVSICMSLCLVGAIAKPLREFINNLCLDPASTNFWLRFTLVMMFLSPLFTATAFGLPSPAFLRTLETGEVVQRIVTASLVGSFLAMLGMGAWISSLTRRALAQQMVRGAPRPDMP